MAVDSKEPAPPSEPSGWTHALQLRMEQLHEGGGHVCVILDESGWATESAQALRVLSVTQSRPLRALLRRARGQPSFVQAVVEMPRTTPEDAGPPQPSQLIGGGHFSRCDLKLPLAFAWAFVLVPTAFALRFVSVVLSDRDTLDKVATAGSFRAFVLSMLLSFAFKDPVAILVISALPIRSSWSGKPAALVAGTLAGLVTI